jgi:DNA-binding cell septation regulator SpoVG
VIPAITKVVLAPALGGECGSGLLGWVSFDLDEALRIDGVALRRRLDGRLTLSFPCRRGKAGERHPYLRPLDAQARALVERQVFEALGLKEDVA